MEVAAEILLADLKNDGSFRKEEVLLSQAGIVRREVEVDAIDASSDVEVAPVLVQHTAVGIGRCTSQYDPTI